MNSLFSYDNYGYFNQGYRINYGDYSGLQVNLRQLNQPISLFSNPITGFNKEPELQQKFRETDNAELKREKSFGDITTNYENFTGPKPDRKPDKTQASTVEEDKGFFEGLGDAISGFTDKIGEAIGSGLSAIGLDGLADDLGLTSEETEDTETQNPEAEAASNARGQTESTGGETKGPEGGEASGEAGGEGGEGSEGAEK